MLARGLPNYPGPFRVAVQDVETDPVAVEGESGSPGELAPGLLFRIYYPTDDLPEPGHPEPVQASWLPEGRQNIYAKAMATFLKLPSVLGSLVIYPTLCSVKMPGILDQPLLHKLARETKAPDTQFGSKPESQAESEATANTTLNATLNSNATAKTETEATSQSVSAALARFPVCIFAHGLGGTRTMYSHYCGILASHGIVTFAIEFGDQSALVSYRTKTPASVVEARLLTPDSFSTPVAPPPSSSSSSSSSSLPPITALIPYFEYWKAKPPAGVDGDQFLLGKRKVQMSRKHEEIERLVQWIQDLHQGTKSAGTSEPASAPSLAPSATSSSSSSWMHWLSNGSSKKESPKRPGDSLDEIRKRFRQRLDLDNFILAGHSFGAATVIKHLQGKSSQKFRCAIIHDPWMLAVDNLPVDSTVPLLSIQSETFHWRSNITALQAIFEKANASSLFAVILQTAHQNLSDLPLMFPSLLRKVKMAGSADELQVMKDYEGLTITWLSQVLGAVRDVDLPVSTNYNGLEDPSHVQSGVLVGQKAIDCIYKYIEEQEQEQKSSNKSN
ncbi:platelet-activating factor acetylhydrolase, isoform II-domain-containing protein [Polychytrium aggregatum]|uniref:platelet-activating factor acetylhydrolase, isoform II-domain-containing protein n=1 Tax=Polychytrium aggregatum TaxID=110093 RepID=UPI0022FE9656|nr:platelet-activating factor acetylhydrolase, isoform II-domain-containing protein [Polychytrium aggregatum]KAI9193046.1 platelet-activating factor acetylhydrolase, isoform II-domain-containing protein [Polychytrium aggregatum]